MDRSAINFMEQLAGEVHALQAHTRRSYVVIAESDLNDPRLVTAPEAGGYGLDAQWSDDFHHALFSVLTGDRSGYYADFGTFADLAKSLREVFVYDGRYSPYRDRIHGRPVPNLPASRFLGYSQNHDQVGNRAKGDRLSSIVSPARAKIAAVLELTAPFVPMLFQGEEWAASAPFQYFTNHEPELGRLVSEGRKKEFAAFGWDPAEVPDPQSPATFQRSKLNWAERSQSPHAEILDWYRRLIALRRSMPDLTDPDLTHTHVRFSESEQWLAMERGSVIVAFSLAPNPIQLEVHPNSTIALASTPDVQLNNNALTLPPDSVAVLKTDRPI
jgi:maltooligosyltrehalose trehalohydrolase